MSMITVTEKINGKNVNKLPDQEIEVQFTIAENLQDAIQDAGGEQNLVDAYNDAKSGRAKQAGRNLYRNAAEGSVVAEIVEKVKAAVSGFSFATSQRGMGVKTKAEKVDNLLNALKEGKEFTREELMQMLMSR